MSHSEWPFLSMGSMGNCMILWDKIIKYQQDEFNFTMSGFTLPFVYSHMLGYNNLNQSIQTKPDQKLSLFWASLYSSSYSQYDAWCTAYIRITLSPPKYTFLGHKKINFLTNQNDILFTSVNGASAWYLKLCLCRPSPNSHRSFTLMLLKHSNWQVIICHCSEIRLRGKYENIKREGKNSLKEKTCSTRLALFSE